MMEMLLVAVDITVWNYLNFIFYYPILTIDHHLNAALLVLNVRSTFTLVLPVSSRKEIFSNITVHNVRYLQIHRWFLFLISQNLLAVPAIILICFQPPFMTWVILHIYLIKHFFLVVDLLVISNV